MRFIYWSVNKHAIFIENSPRQCSFVLKKKKLWREPLIKQDSDLRKWRRKSTVKPDLLRLKSINWRLSGRWYRSCSLFHLSTRMKTEDRRRSRWWYCVYSKTVYYSYVYRYSKMLTVTIRNPVIYFFNRHQISVLCKFLYISVWI